VLTVSPVGSREVLKNCKGKTGTPTRPAMSNARNTAAGLNGRCSQTSVACGDGLFGFFFEDDVPGRCDAGRVGMLELVFVVEATDGSESSLHKRATGGWV
jgi:hypothetical protein